MLPEDKPSEYNQATPCQVRTDEGSHKLALVEASLVELSNIFADSLAYVFDLDTRLSSPPEAVKDFIVRFAKKEEEAAERYSLTHQNRREEERISCSCSVVAVPVTRQFARDGEPFMASIRDVTRNGIRLLHTRVSSAQYLALSWHPETLPYSKIRLVTVVTRCGAMSPFYEISGKFVLAD